MGRLIYRPDNVVSRLDALINKARLAIQISSSGRQSALVWTRAHQLRKLLIWLQPSGRMHSRYGNWVLKNCRPDVHPPWYGRAKPYMEITCSGRTTVQTSVSYSCPSGRLKFTVRTVSVHITVVAHSAAQPINRGPWALRTVRIRYWIPQELREVQDPSEAVTNVLRYIWSLS
jgi:hypothetical protein